jgi:hypothetical protein
VVFELTPLTSGVGPWMQTVLYTFTGDLDGGNPSAGLVFVSKGNLYGTAEGGGAHTMGVAFELSPPANGSLPWTEKVLYSFAGGSDGQSPNSALVFDSHGNLYGATEGGGVSTTICGSSTCGVVFKLAYAGGAWTESVIHAFTGESDGGSPGAVVVGAKNNLFGGASKGGNTGACSGGCGVVYALSPNVLTITSSKNPSGQGQSVTFIATIRPNPGAVGVVAFMTGTTTLCAAAAVDSAGGATCVTTALPVGSDVVTAEYSGTGWGYLTQTVTESELIQNGGFEIGTLAYWNASTGGCSPVATRTQKHSGADSASMGAPVQSTCAASEVYLYQAVTIPSYAAHAKLSLWYRPQTNNTSNTTNYYAIAVKNTSGVTLINCLIVASNSQTWTNQTCGLDAYIGQAIWIFNAYYNNGSTHGGVFLDDFSLNLE